MISSHALQALHSDDSGNLNVRKSIRHRAVNKEKLIYFYSIEREFNS